MTIIEALNKFDREYPNQYPRNEKIRDLSDLDKMVFNNIMYAHSDGAAQFVPYNGDTSVTQNLLLPDTESTLYILWLKAKLDFYNRDYGEYNNSSSVFNYALELFERSYSRKHRSCGVKKLAF